MKTSRNKLSALVAGAVALSAQAAFAQERSFGYSATITGASDYIFRGYSFTQSDPTVNAYLELTYGIAYLGFWTSNIDTGSAADAAPGYGFLGSWEQDVYIGIRPTTGPVQWDFGALWYIYGVKGAGVGTSDYDYVELKANASVSLSDALSVGFTAYFTPDQGLATPQSQTAEGAITYSLPKVGAFQPTLGATVGYWHFEENSKYQGGYFVDDSGKDTDALIYWNAGVRLDVDRFFFDFRYWDTNLKTKDSDARFVFSAGINLLP